MQPICRQFFWPGAFPLRAGGTSFGDYIRSLVRLHLRPKQEVWGVRLGCPHRSQSLYSRLLSQTPSLAGPSASVIPCDLLRLEPGFSAWRLMQVRSRWRGFLLFHTDLQNSHNSTSKRRAKKCGKKIGKLSVPRAAVRATMSHACRMELPALICTCWNCLVECCIVSRARGAPRACTVSLKALTLK